MNSRWNTPANKELTIEDIVQSGGYYDIDGLWNSIIRIEDKIYRGRVETLLIDDNKNIYMQLTDNGSYRIPGGSFEKDVNNIVQAAAEVLEEAKIICDNVTYTGIHYLKEFNDKFKDEDGKINWNGTYNEVYIATYVKPYIGAIHPKNKDNEMYKLGKFYPISEVYDRLKDPHKEALKDLYEKPNTIPVKESKEDIIIDSKNNISKMFIGSISESSNIKQNFYPYFTPKEMCKLGVMNEGHNFFKEDVEVDDFTRKWFDNYKKNPDIPTSKDWFDKLTTLYGDYKKDPTDNLKQQILNLGWNPEVPVNMTNIDKVRNLTKEIDNPDKYVGVEEDFNILENDHLYTSEYSSLMSHNSVLEQGQYEKDKDVVEIAIKESIIFNNKDISVNAKNWKNNKSNVLLVTGLSGSGKTTLSNDWAKDYNAIMIQLDYFQNYSVLPLTDTSIDTIKYIDEYMKLNPNVKVKSNKFSNINLDTFSTYFVPFFNWLMEKLTKDKNTKYIIEGIHIMLFIPYNDIKQYPLYCINTSVTNSITRHWMRDGWGLRDIIKQGYNDFNTFTKWDDAYDSFKDNINEESLFESNDAIKLQNLVTEHVSILEAVSSGKKPIFIVNSYTNTMAGKVIKAWTHSTYTHTAISFNTELENLYSFNAYNGIRRLGGFSEESLSEYINKYKDTLISVRCIFVKESDFNIVKNTLDNMIKNQDKTTYSYSNILNILLNKAKDMSDDAVSMVCSQFVTYILKRANIDISNKPINLTTPNDLATIENPRMYLLYAGKAVGYNKNEIDRIFRKIKRKALLIKEENEEISISEQEYLENFVK